VLKLVRGLVLASQASLPIAWSVKASKALKNRQMGTVGVIRTSQGLSEVVSSKPRVTHNQPTATQGSQKLSAWLQMFYAQHPFTLHCLYNDTCFDVFSIIGKVGRHLGGESCGCRDYTEGVLNLARR
jgi:Na+/melibiose symporter-like transporter